jgi:hypothetical protein
MKNIASAKEYGGETVPKRTFCTTSLVQLKELRVTLLPDYCTAGGDLLNGAACTAVVKQLQQDEGEAELGKGWEKEIIIKLSQ